MRHYLESEDHTWDESFQEHLEEHPMMDEPPPIPEVHENCENQKARPRRLHGAARERRVGIVKHLKTESSEVGEDAERFLSIVEMRVNKALDNQQKRKRAARLRRDEERSKAIAQQILGEKQQFSQEEIRHAATVIGAALKGWATRGREKAKAVPPFEFSRYGIVFKHTGRRKSISELYENPKETNSNEFVPQQGTAGAVLQQDTPLAYQLMVRARNEVPEGSFGDWRKAMRAVGRNPDHRDEAREFRGAEYMKDLVRRDLYAPTDRRDVKEADIEVMQQFRLLDKEGTGYVSRKDFYNWLNKIGLHHEKKFVKDVVMAADRNGDGRLDYEVMNG